MVHRVIQRGVAAAVLRGQRQPRQRLHRPVRAQHLIGRLEQLITAGGQSAMEIQPGPRQHGERPDINGMLNPAIHHGLRCDHGSFGENT